MSTQKVKLGRTVRDSFARTNEVLEMPDLIEIQRESYRWFEEVGLREAFDGISPIQDFTGNLSLELLDYYFAEPKYSVDESRERDVTFSRPLRAKVRLHNKETGEVKEQEVFMGDFPIMTEKGTFIYNGAERVIVSQLVRSPGAYYKIKPDKDHNRLIEAKVIPNRGAWIEYSYDKRGVVYVRVDRSRKVPVTVFLRALGYGENAEIYTLLGEGAQVGATIEKDNTSKTSEGLIEIYRKIRPGEPPTEEASQAMIKSMFFQEKRYDLAKVGRYKFNKKLSFDHRLRGRISATNIVADENIYAPTTEINKETGEVIRQIGQLLIAKGEVLVQANQAITEVDIQRLKLAGINSVGIKLEDGRVINVIGNGYKKVTWDEKLINQTILSAIQLKKSVIFPANTYIDGDCLKKLKRHISSLSGTVVELESGETVVISTDYYKNDVKCLTKEDIIASISYVFNLLDGVGNFDDIDHLGNRRLRCVGELLQNEFRTGLSRMERVVRERMTIQDTESITPQALINIRPVVAKVKEFFGSSQLSQFMDQTNPLSELSHKRTLSALGPGGLNRDRASFDVRDVHHSHFGRICPIETPEGPNIGLIGRLGTYTQINEFGFMQTPYRVVDKVTGRVTDEIRYFTADEEEGYYFGQSNLDIDAEGRILDEQCPVRVDHDVRAVSPEQVDFIDVSPKQIFSIATALIPFLENDDANRALMGANMQKQAVPLLRPQAPIVGTGMEHKAALDSGHVVIAKRSGRVSYVSGRRIEITTPDNETDIYNLHKFERSNQGTCINQRPLVKPSEEIAIGDIIADGSSVDNGELALGRNMLVGFLNWNGYNYEDAIIINENVVKQDSLTSLHIEEYEGEARDTKLGPEEITRDIPNVGEDALKDLDERGIVRIGAEVKSGDILIGKVTPKGETELTAEERLLRAIFGEKAREVRDTSTKVPHGTTGIVVDVNIFTKANGDELPPGVSQLVRVYVAKKRKISVGDKMAGRHGNKGIVARIVPEEDMPFLPDGRPLDIILTPLGIPSRMNIGQIFETHIGWAASELGLKVATPVFDGATEVQIREWLRRAGLPETGKTTLYDGQTGKAFSNPVTVGQIYMLKLFHLVADKIHARSTGPYSLVTQQPLGGKAQFGGQRFGEMEVWALEAYGAAYTLQEMLTVKSDDVIGRVKTYEAIVKGENIPEPGIPESFKVLIKEMQSLSLDVRILAGEEAIDAENIALEEYDIPFEVSPSNEEVFLDVEENPNQIIADVADDEMLSYVDDEEQIDVDHIDDGPSILGKLLRSLSESDAEQDSEADEETEEREMTTAERIAKLSQIIRPRDDIR